MNIALQSILDSLPDAIVVLSRDGTIVFANAPATELFGRSLAGQVQLADLALDPPEKLTKYLEFWSRSQRGLPGSLRLQAGNEELHCTVQGGRVPPTDSEQALTWVRLTPKQPGSNKFLALNERIGKLAGEIAARRRVEELLSSQRQVLEMLARDCPCDEVLRALVAMVERNSTGGALCSVMVLDEDNVHLRCGACDSLPKGWTEIIDGLEIGPKVGSCGTAAFLRDTVIVTDILQDPLWKDYRDQAIKFGLRACWSTPIIGKTGEVFGTLALYYSAPKAPSEAELRAAEVAARTAAIAIEKARASAERGRTEAALRRSEKLAAAGRLAATIAHEINNPLEAISNLLYLLNTNPNLDETSRAYLTLAEQELARVAHITKQTLGFYRETGASKNVELNAMFEELLYIYSGRIRSKNISVETRLEPTPPIFAAEGELRQLFSNFIANAIDALPQGGRVQIFVRPCVHRNSEATCVEVIDNGVGIPEELRRRVFEPFFTTKAEVGTGLGLWVAKGIVEKYSGTIAIESSTNPGHSGTTFRVVLPNLAAQLEAIPATRSMV